MLLAGIRGRSLMENSDTVTALGRKREGGGAEMGAALLEARHRLCLTSLSLTD